MFSYFRHTKWYHNFDVWIHQVCYSHDHIGEDDDKHCSASHSTKLRPESVVSTGPYFTWITFTDGFILQISSFKLLLQMIVLTFCAQFWPLFVPISSVKNDRDDKHLSRWCWVLKTIQSKDDNNCRWRASVYYKKCALFSLHRYALYVIMHFYVYLTLVIMHAPGRTTDLRGLQ